MEADPETGGAGGGAGERPVPPRRQRGAAFALALVVVALLSLLGLAFALMAQDENRIAWNHLRGNQALFAAEGAARCVRGWFERPDPSSGFLVPLPSQVDRTRRRVDPDGDGVHQPYATATPPWNVLYRQGCDDLFERPYRGGPALSFEGDPRGPDVRIARDGSAGERAFLEALSEGLFPGFPSERERARVVRIDLYSPPHFVSSGRKVRVGIVTVEATVAILANFGTSSEREVAARTVRAVLGDLPYRSAAGPLLVAGDADIRAGVEARWGLAAARGDLMLPGTGSVAAPSGWPRRAAGRPLLPDEDGDGTREDTDADGTADWEEWWSTPDDTLEDPWFFASAGGRLVPAPGSEGPDHLPWPFDPAALPAGPDGPWDPDADRSNRLQQAAAATVPDTGYELWRMAARSGFRGHRYFAFDASSGRWREDGTGTPRSVEEATRGEAGLFFFETADGLPPADSDGDGLADNLAPAVSLGPGWSASGAMVIAAREVRLAGIGWGGPRRALRLPGEPCADLDRDGRCGTDEPFLRLDYPPDPLAPGAQYRRAAFETPPAALARRTEGPEIVVPIAFEGLLVAAGHLIAGGDANLYGGVLVGGSLLAEPTGGPPATGTLRLLADHRMSAGLSPAAETGAPRTVVLSWQVERSPAPLSAP